jgi:hypothetical protein
MCYIMYGDEEGKLCEILLANKLRMKNIIMANQCIKDVKVHKGGE